MMRLLTFTKYFTLITLSLSSLSLFAYDDDKDKERCRNPKVQEFTLPVYEEPDRKEAQAETEFSFIVSGWADPKKFELSGKNMDIPFTVESSETFHKIKAKLPPEFNGKFVRLNARIPAVLGCYTTIGWLIKVTDKPKPAETGVQPANPVESTVPKEAAKPESIPDTETTAEPQK